MLRGGECRAGGVRCALPALGRGHDRLRTLFQGTGISQVCGRRGDFSRNAKNFSGGRSKRVLGMSCM